MPKNQNRKKKSAVPNAQQEHLEGTRFGTMEIDTLESSSSSSNSPVSPLPTPAPAQEAARNEAPNPKETASISTPHAAPPSGGESLLPSFGLSKIVDPFRKPRNSAESMKPETEDMVDSLDGVISEDASYALTLSKPHPTTPSVAHVENSKVVVENVDGPVLPKATPSAHGAKGKVSPIDKWARNHGSGDMSKEAEGPKFDPSLVNRLSQQDPQSQVPPQLSHLVADKRESQSPKGNLTPNKLNSRPSSASPTHSKRYSMTSPLLHEVNHENGYETPRDAPRPQHVLHGLLTLFTAGLWLPVWIGACCGWGCQRPMESAASCCDGRTKKPKIPTA